MKRFMILILFVRIIFAQSDQDDRTIDSTFIILKSGNSLRVNKLDADFTIQPLIKFDLEFSDFDSTKYEISDIHNIVDSQGKPVISRNNLLIMNYFKKCFNISTHAFLWYLILDRFF